jgi:hypothetical protein
MLRFLEGLQWKGKESYEAITNHKKFLDTMYPVNPSNIDRYFELLNKGVCYLYRRDRSYRPIFIFNIKLLSTLGNNFDELLGLSAFLIHFAITRCLVPGRVENWVTIFDMKGVGIT